ncbi:MAG: hypothetical protein WB543_08675 [Candidatus Acidiferrum sp.]
MTILARGTMAMICLTIAAAGTANAKKKEKVYLPGYVLKAQTVLVVILPDAGQTIDDPLANQKAQADVENALMKWGRFRLVQDASQADLVIGIRKGTGKNSNPTINGGPANSPVAIDSKNNQIRVMGRQGPPADATQPGIPTDTAGPDQRAHPGMEVGARDDTFDLFQGGVQYPVEGAVVWKYVAKDGLKPPGVAAVDQFRIAIEESEKAAQQKQQQSQQKGQKKNP